MEVRPDFVSLMAGLRRGEATAAEELVSALYPELRRIAAHRMRSENAGHSWQPTELVNELYLELRKTLQWRAAAEGDPSDDRQTFLALAGFLMGRLLTHHARPLRKRVPHDEIRAEDLSADPGQGGVESIHQVEDLLDRLGAVDPKLRRVVELKVFEGLSVAEVAHRMDCSERTAARHWSFARAWLQQALDHAPPYR